MAISYCPACLNTFESSPVRCPNMGCGRDRPPTGWGHILSPGDLIDRHYRVDQVLALGGAGMTYLARAVDAGGHPIEPRLAIKVLFEERASGTFLRRLANEAQLLQDLDHDHIVRSRGFVQRAGQPPYLVTLFEAGGTLQEHVQRVGGLPAPAASGVLWQILKALSMAHGSDVVHRDLKPANVLLADSCERDVTPWVRVADFGIAKVSASIGAGLTQVGTFIGTPEYAAPEQLEGLSPVPATDLFAAGGLLFFMLTGRPPIQLSMRGDPMAVYEVLLEQLPPQLPPLGIEDETQRRLQRVIDNVSVASIDERWSVPRILEELGPLITKPARPKPVPTARPQPQHRAAEPTMAGWTHPPPAPKLSAYDATLLEPLPDEPPPAPQLPAVGDYTVVDEPPPQASTALARPEPVAKPVPVPEPAPRALSLDDLFGGGTPAPRPSSAPSRAAPAPPPVDDDPFAMLGRLTKPPPAPVDDNPFTALAPTATSSAPNAHAPPPAAAPSVPATTWAPAKPRALPYPLPSDPESLLGLLGSVRPEDRRAPVAQLEALPRPELSRALRAWRPGGIAAVGRGAGLAIAAIGGSDLAAIARNLTRAKDPEVRACAAEALGMVGQGSLLSTLSRMVDDKEPVVRVAACLAVGRACSRTGDRSMGVAWLQRIAQETNQAVATARDRALGQLGG